MQLSGNDISDPELIINDLEKRVRNSSDRRTSLSSHTDVSGWVQEALSDDLTESDSDNDVLAPSLDLHLSSDSDSEFNPDESTSDLYLDLRLDTDTSTLACSSSNSIEIPQDECQPAGSSSQSSVTVSAFSIFPSAPACQDSEAPPTIFESIF